MEDHCGPRNTKQGRINEGDERIDAIDPSSWVVYELS